MIDGIALNEIHDKDEKMLKNMLEQIEKGNKDIITSFYEQFKVKEFGLEQDKINPNEDLFVVNLNTLDEKTLVILHQNTPWLAPAYFLRKKFFGKWHELEDETLLILTQTLSKKAKAELYVRYSNNLKKASDELLVLMAQDQNEVALEVLFERYMPFVKGTIRRLDRKFFFRGYDMDDLYQEGIIGLFKSKDDYKIERKTRFKDFSRHVIEKHIGTLILRSSNYKNKVLNESFSYHSPIGSDSEVTFEQLLKSEANGPELVTVNRETYFAIKDKLTELENEVLKYYAQGLSYEEIGEIVDKKKKAIDNTIQRIRKKGKSYEKTHIDVSDDEILLDAEVIKWICLLYQVSGEESLSIVRNYRKRLPRRVDNTYDDRVLAERIYENYINEQ